MSTRRLSVSAVKTFQRCPRFYKHLYLDRRVPHGTSDDLQFGTALHAALAAWYRGEDDLAKLVEIAQSEVDHSGVVFWETLIALMDGYSVHRASDRKRYEVIGVELRFEGHAYGVPLQGFIDGLLLDHETGEKWVLEHKSTRSNIGDGGSYWAARQLDLQCLLYIYGARELGHDVRGVLYNVVRRPMYRFRGLTDTRENLVERIRTAITKDVRDNEGRSFYGRKAFQWSEDQVAATLSDIKYTSDLVQLCTRSNQWPRNLEQCHGFGRSCDYLEVCSGRADINGEMFTERQRR